MFHVSLTYLRNKYGWTDRLIRHCQSTKPSGTCLTMPGHAKTRPQAPANLIKGTAAVSAEYAGVKRTRTPRGSVRVQN